MSYEWEILQYRIDWIAEINELFKAINEEG